MDGLEVQKRVQAGWQSWMDMSDSVIYNRKIEARVKRKVYRGSETCCYVWIEDSGTTKKTSNVRYAKIAIGSEQNVQNP